MLFKRVGILQRLDVHVCAYLYKYIYIHIYLYLYRCTYTFDDTEGMGVRVAARSFEGSATERTRLERETATSP